MERKKLYRSRRDRVIGGVAGGLAEYFELDSTLVRIFFVILALLDGLGILLYVVGLILIPEEPEKGEKMAKKEQEPVVNQKINEAAEKVKDALNDGPSKGRMIGGIVLILLGAMFLIQIFWPEVDGRVFLGALLIILGLFVISGRK